jgi:hypothetical protein
MDVVTCSVCTELMKVPVPTPCGHSFCRACVQDCCAAGDNVEARCPLCRAPLVAAPWPARAEPYTSRQSAVIAGWCESFPTRATCDLVRAAQPPLSSTAAASAVLRYVRGAGYAADEGRVEALLARIADGDLVTADSHNRTIVWWLLYTVVFRMEHRYRACLFEPIDKDGCSAFSATLSACNRVGPAGGKSFAWGIASLMGPLKAKYPELATWPLAKLRDAGIAHAFQRLVRKPCKLADLSRGERFAALLKAAPALVLLDDYKDNCASIRIFMGFWLEWEAKVAASKIAAA